MWRPLAEQGNDGAQFDLGFMYDNGDGVPRDYQEAIAWYRRAADQGNDRAQYNLGLMYYKGKDVPQNYVQAYKWFSIAGANGNKVGTSNRDILEKEMTPGQVAVAQKLTREWLARHP